MVQDRITRPAGAAALFVVCLLTAAAARAELSAGRGGSDAQAAGHAAAAAPAAAMAWDGADRTEVAVAFARHYLPAQDYETHLGWTGDVGQCMSGAPSQLFLDRTMSRVNYFRAQAGIAADVQGDAALDAQCQQAALVMARQGQTSHYPADDFPGNPCLSDAADTAAAKSNLLLDSIGPPAIDRLMKDPGVSNRYVGHRRWLLYPRQQVMGNGAIPAAGAYRAAHCNHVIGGFKPSQPTQAVPWPNEGFVPWQVVPNDGDDPPRWSFSYAGAGFASATVSVEKLGADGGMMAVTREQVGNGYGDNTLVWKIDGVPASAPEQDTTYRVTIGGVTGAGQSSFVYDVTVIDPYDLGLDLQPHGPEEPVVGGESVYGFGGFEHADGFDVRVARASDGDWLEGAESASAPVIDQTTGAYDLRTTLVKASGQKSFHLTAPSLQEPEQAFIIDRIVVPSAASTLRFKNLRRCASQTSALHAQVSRDGQSWRTLWSRTGQALILCSSADWDAGFQSVSASFPADLVGQTVQVRFLYRIAGPLVFGGTGSSLGFFIDDIEVSGSRELVDASETELPAGATSFSLTPQHEEELWLQVRPRVADVRYGYGTPAVVFAVEGEVLCGDGSGDGEITASDALLALKAAVGAASCVLAVCDVNDSGGLTASDALLVLKFAVGGAVTLDCPMP